jgi:hypothetical protein
MFEEFSVDRERGANWRWYLRLDGAWFHASNDMLWAEGPPSTAPAEHWNTAFTAEPVRRFDASWMERIRAAVDAAGLRDDGGVETNGSGSEVVLQRWTLVENGRQHVALLGRGEAPPGLAQLARTIDEAVAESA